jgi:hypothetical protein
MNPYLLLLAAALYLSGMHNKNQSIKAAQEAQKKAYQEEIARRQGYEKEGREKFDTALETLDAGKFKEDLVNRTNATATEYENAINNPNVQSQAAPFSGRGPRVLQGVESQVQNRMTEKAIDEAALRAALSAFGGQLSDSTEGLTESNIASAITGTKSMGSAGANRYEMMDAQNKAINLPAEAMMDAAMLAATFGLKKSGGETNTAEKPSTASSTASWYQ